MAVEGFSFGLRDCKIAPRTASATFGTAVDVEAIRVFNCSLEFTNGRLEGDDRRKSIYAITVGGTAQMEFGFKDLTVLATLGGWTEVDSTTYKALTFTVKTMPYIAIAGQVFQEDGVGGYDLFIPCGKIMQNLQFANLQYGTYWSQRVDVEFIDDDSQYGLARIYARTTASALSIPPA